MVLSRAFMFRQQCLSKCVKRVTHRLNMQRRFNPKLQEARHPNAILALLAVGKTGRRCDFMVIDGMCLDLLRFTEDERFLIYNDVSGEKVCNF